MNSATQPAADPIDHPAHYRVGGLECWDVIRAYRLGYHLGNALKYVWRCGRKSEHRAEDLRKALAYLRNAAEAGGRDLVHGLPDDAGRPLPIEIAEALGLSVALSRAVSVILSPVPDWRDLHLAAVHIGTELASIDRELAEAPAP